MSQNSFIRSTLFLTCAGFLSRFLGFFYRIFLSHTIGAHGLGIYQLILPLQTLLTALGFSGIYTTISKLCASHLALKEEKEAHRIFFIGTFFSFIISLFLCLILYFYSDFFANAILHEPSTAPLLKLLSFTFPLNAIHNCVNHYCFAQKQTFFPSVMQFVEQIVRVGSSYLLYLICISEGREITPIIAVYGTVFSEIIVVLLCIFYYELHFPHISLSLFHLNTLLSTTYNLFSMALPLSINKTLLTFLSSIESILIPQRLLLHGISNTTALSIYGTFTGMALPVILFPSTLIHAVSVILLPSVSQLHALKKQDKIYSMIKNISFFSFSFGFFCVAFFFLCGETLGSLLFHDSSAGIFIRSTSFICPFLYTNILYTSILNGIGKPVICLLNNFICISIRLFFVIFAIPKYGISGYFYGIMTGELILTLLHLNSFYITYRQ